MPNLSAKLPRLIRPGARCLAAAGLLALIAPAARADDAYNACATTFETLSGELQIAPLPERDGEIFLELNLELQGDLGSADERPVSVAFFGLIESPVTADAIPAALDNIWVTFNFGDASRVDGPTLVYYTRDNTVPLDIAPAKLWYPKDRSRSGQFEVVVSLGDLERQMQFGPDAEPVYALTWIAKRVGDGRDSDAVIDSGDVPLQPIRTARDEIEAALHRRALVAQQGGTC